MELYVLVYLDGVICFIYLLGESDVLICFRWNIYSNIFHRILDVLIFR